MRPLYLILLGYKVRWQRFVEWTKVVRRYYRNKHFRCADLNLLRRYLGHSPYAVSRDFLRQTKAGEGYTYGETPLTTLADIVQKTGIGPSDTLYELGSGPGRTSLWLRLCLGCSVVAIERIPTFVDRLQSVISHYRLDRITACEQDILTVDYKPATAIYLYGTCFDDPFIETLANRLKQLQSGVKVVTVSYPLTDYDNKHFTLVDYFPARFPWGEGQVYLQVRV